MASVTVTTVDCDMCGARVEDPKAPESLWDLGPSKNGLRALDLCTKCREPLAAYYAKGDAKRVTGRMSVRAKRTRPQTVRGPVEPTPAAVPAEPAPHADASSSPTGVTFGPSFSMGRQ